MNPMNPMKPMNSLLALVAAALLVHSPRPAAAQTVPNGCLMQYSAATCTGWVVGAAVCYDRRNPAADSSLTSRVAVQTLQGMGIGLAYIDTSEARRAGLDFISRWCP
jgi:hypothetical protein